MTRRTVTLIQELPHFLRTCSVEELYQVARALRHDLVRRGMTAALAADELAELLLIEARIEHRAIFSGDCTSGPEWEKALVGAFLAGYDRAFPRGKKS
jgi:hypothetical protein